MCSLPGRLKVSITYVEEAEFTLEAQSSLSKGVTSLADDKVVGDRDSIFGFDEFSIFTCKN